jgi:hypothetical protein
MHFQSLVHSFRQTWTVAHRVLLSVVVGHSGILTVLQYQSGPESQKPHHSCSYYFPVLHRPSLPFTPHLFPPSWTCPLNAHTHPHQFSEGMCSHTRSTRAIGRPTQRQCQECRQLKGVGGEVPRTWESLGQIWGKHWRGGTQTNKYHLEVTWTMLTVYVLNTPDLVFFQDKQSMKEREESRVQVFDSTLGTKFSL